MLWSICGLLTFSSRSSTTAIIGPFRSSLCLFLFEMCLYPLYGQCNTYRYRVFFLVLHQIFVPRSSFSHRTKAPYLSIPQDRSQRCRTVLILNFSRPFLLRAVFSFPRVIYCHCGFLQLNYHYIWARRFFPL